MIRNDRFWHGFLPGLVGPVVGAVIFYFLQLNHMSFSEFLDSAVRPSVLSPLLSFGALVNLAIFFAFISFNRHKSSRGVIFATLLYGALIIVLKAF